MIDPNERWREYGGKPDYAGLLTFGGLPYTEDPGKLEGVDVAVVGAPTDDLVSNRPGTRFGPRAIRAASCSPGEHLEAKIDAFVELKMVDFGDAPVVPADPARSHQAIEATVGQVLAAGAIPIVLGGDHSIAAPDIRACAAKHGPVGLVHFDTHTDTGKEVFGVEVSHGTPMYRLVEEGSVDPTRYVQVGLRGYWPGPAEFAWQAEKGIRSFFAHDVRNVGNRMTFRFVCKGEEPMEGTGEITSTPTSYDGRMTMKGTRRGSDMNMVQNFSGKKVGTCTDTSAQTIAKIEAEGAAQGSRMRAEGKESLFA